MEIGLPTRASAVVIGGGVVGASVAYHLAKQGWQDVVMLERQQFGCGTSWHAAGLIGTMRASENHAKLCEYSMSLLSSLEEETGQSTGFRQVGSLSIAHSAARFEELKRVAAMNNAFGVTRVDIIGVQEIESLYPLLNTSGLLGGSWVEQDGQASPLDVVNAFIKGARQLGVLCLENMKVVGIGETNGKVSSVRTEHGDISCDFVVNAAGLWSRSVGRLAGVNVPLYACEHYYAHTEKLPDLPRDLPVLRDHDRSAYIREDAGSLLIGAFEPRAVPLPLEEIADDFCFDELPGHVEQQLMPVLEDMIFRLPLLQDTGWRSFFCGPESFTPDDQFHLGQVPELKNFYVACGLNSVGIQTAGGIGKACAEWMNNGYPPMDLWDNDIRRMGLFQGTEKYLKERVSESLGLLYANHYPYRQYISARNVRHSPIHERLIQSNACFGEVAGWERPNWFAPEGIAPVYEYSFGRQNWFEYSATEHHAARNGVALFDQSSFSKYLVQGGDACKVLQRICTADIDIELDQTRYTHWLNVRGGIEADLTVTRLREDRYFVVSGPAVTLRDLDWLSQNIGDSDHCTCTDVTSAWAVFGIMGPGSRTFLEQVTGKDFSNRAFPHRSSQLIEIGSTVARAIRMSYVGEMGWEIYLPADQARHGFDMLIDVGKGHGVVLSGMHALDSCRIEKKFVHFGHDISDEDTPIEAGTRYVCNFGKKIPFIGRDALLQQLEANEAPTKRLVQFLLSDSEPMLYHHEPILRDGEIVGHLRSGNYGHTLGGAVGLGYVRCNSGVNTDFINSSQWSINVAGDLIPATASLTALYDPKGERVRG